MNIDQITTELMKILELKLLDHIPSNEFNRNNITRNVMNNLMQNIFMKSLHEVQNSGAINVMMPQQVIKVCLDKCIDSFTNDSESIKNAFNAYLKQHQSEEIFDEASQMGEYLIGALPVLIGEYLEKADFSQ